MHAYMLPALLATLMQTPEDITGICIRLVSAASLHFLSLTRPAFGGTDLIFTTSTRSWHWFWGGAGLLLSYSQVLFTSEITLDLTEITVPVGLFIVVFSLSLLYRLKIPQREAEKYRYLC